MRAMRLHARLAAALLLAACASAALLPDPVLLPALRQDIVINKQSPDPSQSAQPSQPPQPLVPFPQSSPVVLPSATPSPGVSQLPTASAAVPTPTSQSSVAPPGLVPPPRSADSSPTPSTSVSPAAEKRRTTALGVIIGAVIGGLLLLVLVILLLCVVFCGRSRERSGGLPPSGAGGYSTPESATRGLGAAAVAGAGAGGAAVAGRGAVLPTDNSDGGTIQDIELAEAEATMPSYTVSDAARHHGGASTAAVLPAAAGAGSRGGVAATSGRSPTPPPHDYVVGAGPISSRTDFDDIKNRFARDEIGDSTAILGASSLIEGATDPSTASLEGPTGVAGASAATASQMPDMPAPPPQQHRGLGMSDLVPEAPTPPSFNGANGGDGLARSAPVPPTFLAQPRGEESAPPADIATEALPSDLDKPIIVEAPRSAVEASYEIAPDASDVIGKPDRDAAPMSFDTQDKLSHSAQDFSGSISEAAPAFAVAPIIEEVPETAALDRDAMPPRN